MKANFAYLDSLEIAIARSDPEILACTSDAGHLKRICVLVDDVLEFDAPRCCPDTSDTVELTINLCNLQAINLKSRHPNQGDAHLDLGSKYSSSKRINRLPSL